MKIETKYNIGQEVWVKTSSKKAYCDIITEIRILRGELIVYSLLTLTNRIEDELFPTKEELLNSL